MNDGANDPNSIVGAEMRSDLVVSLDISSASYANTQILGQVQFYARSGETVAICGPSGVGKSTLVRILAGLFHNFKGTCDTPDCVAMVFQEPNLLPWRSARDNIVLATGVTAKAADDVLSEVGLGKLGDRLPGQLSLGQQRRVSLARAFAVKSDLLLLDEPFVSLDPELGDEMMGVFERLRAASDVTSVLVTHSQDEARRLADRILTLKGSPAELVVRDPNADTIRAV